jgi:stearoyl-CoA desaturase (Delta-9 desaturase)
LSSTPTRRPFYWENIGALIVTHGLGILGIVYLAMGKASIWSVALGVLWFVFCMLGLTAGYHRLFAHPTYRARGIVRFFALLFGAASAQASALLWSSDHRVHHGRLDEEEDPYNIRKGFWWAHMGWLLYRAPPSTLDNVKDLRADPMIRFQHRFYVPLMLAVGFALPAAIGALWGDALGGLLLGGFLRVMVQYQATFCINSVAHTVGRRPYSTSVSARDSWLAAFLTMGEGYHNYHHRFPGDYRNGIRWYQFDPGKWLVWTLSKLGLAAELKRAPREMIDRAIAAVLSEKSGA